MLEIPWWYIGELLLILVHEIHSGGEGDGLLFLLVYVLYLFFYMFSQAGKGGFLFLLCTHDEKSFSGRKWRNVWTISLFIMAHELKFLLYPTCLGIIKSLYM